MATRIKFPSIADVAAELRNVNTIELNAPDEDDVIDVRLQVYPDGEWALRSGLSDYDQDHRGFWGCSSVPGNGKRFRSESIARELISQAKDQAAENGGE